MEKGLTLDSCRKCRGIWLDGGELSRLSTNADEPQLFANALRPSGKGDSRDCPRCNQAMLHGTFPDREVVVDFCDNCHGM